jgi:hypothetical protein
MQSFAGASVGETHALQLYDALAADDLLCLLFSGGSLASSVRLGILYGSIAPYFVNAMSADVGFSETDSNY